MLATVRVRTRRTRDQDDQHSNADSELRRIRRSAHSTGIRSADRGTLTFGRWTRWFRQDLLGRPNSNSQWFQRVQDATRLDAFVDLPKCKAIPAPWSAAARQGVDYGDPPVENRHQARSSDAGESVETLALALSAWDSKFHAANGPATAIQTFLWDRS